MNLKSTSYLSILCTSAPRLISILIYVPAYYGSNHFLNHDRCKYVVLTITEIYIINKFAIHLFVVLRSRLTETEKNKSIWHTLGLFMVGTDILFMIYVMSGIPRFDAIWSEHGHCITDADISIHIWFVGSDFVIGLYFLIVFIYPLRKYMKIEQEHQQENKSVYKYRVSLANIARRIIIFSTLMLATTIICVLIAATVPVLGGMSHFVYLSMTLCCSIG